MKKTLLAFSVFLAATAAQSQVIFEDNFDAYTPGTGVAAQANGAWDTWTGNFAGEDALVSSAYASSGLNSAEINGTSVDLVLPIGPFTSGKYDVEFKMLIPTGSSGAYFNGLHTWSSTSTTYQWAVDVFFDAAGQCTFTCGGTDGVGPIVAFDTWFDVKVTADMDADMGYLSINGILLNSWTWSLNNANGAAGTNQLAGFDFFGTDTNQGEGLYYVDDVKLTNSTGVGITEATAKSDNAVVIAPNPASDFVNITLADAWKGGDLRVMDLMGRVVYQSNISRESMIQHISLNHLSQGVYLVKVKKGNEEFTTKMMVRK
ncbi:MAG: hypothetical protein RLZZ77_111 [Bacteroidota bacterium]|jgi:hypothetical protein